MFGCSVDPGLRVRVGLWGGTQVHCRDPMEAAFLGEGW